jgi:hypothetical protein
MNQRETKIDEAKVLDKSAPKANLRHDASSSGLAPLQSQRPRWSAVSKFSTGVHSWRRNDRIRKLFSSGVRTCPTCYAPPRAVKTA